LRALLVAAVVAATYYYIVHVCFPTLK